MYMYIYSSNPWESNHRDGPMGHKIIGIALQTTRNHRSDLTVLSTCTYN